MWSYRPYQNLEQIDHNLHYPVFDDVIYKPPIVWRFGATMQQKENDVGMHSIGFLQTPAHSTLQCTNIPLFRLPSKAPWFNGIISFLILSVIIECVCYLQNLIHQNLVHQFRLKTFKQKQSKFL